MCMGTSLLGIQIEANAPMLNEWCRVQVGVNQIQRDHCVHIVGAHARAVNGKCGKRKTWCLTDARQDGCLHLYRHSHRRVTVIFEEEEIVDICRMQFCGGVHTKGKSQRRNGFLCWRTTPAPIFLLLIAEWRERSQPLEINITLPLLKTDSIDAGPLLHSRFPGLTQQCCLF